MSTLTLCPPCRSVVKHNAMHSPCQRSWNASAAYAMGESRGRFYRDARAATGAPMSQCHSSGCPIVGNAAERPAGIRTDDGFPTCASCIAARFVLRRVSLRHRSARRSPSVRRGAPSICIRAARSRAFWRPVCVLRAAPWKLAIVNSASGTSSVEPCDKITLRSTTFSSSRTFPGQEYRHSAATVFGATLVIDLLHNCA